MKADLDLKVALIIIRWFSAGKSVLSRRPPQTRESFSLGEDASAAVKSTPGRIDTSQDNVVIFPICSLISSFQNTKVCEQ